MDNIPYELAYGVGALLLLAGLVYAFVQYKRRNRANDALAEEATRQLYDDPRGYEAHQDEMRRKARPS
jgi:hypothetical protein